MSYESIPLDQFQDVFGATSTEISSVALGGHVVSFSDEFFAEASNLLKVEPAVSHKGTFKPTGAVFDGWETRRHNTGYDWCIIRLGAPSGYVIGFDIDTAHFNGNEGPAASVHALFGESQEKPQADDPRVIPQEPEENWTCILPRQKLGPHRQHFFQLENVVGRVYTHVKLTIYPDGGVKRVRIIGTRASSSAPASSSTIPSAPAATEPLTTESSSERAPASDAPTIPALPITCEAFKPYGSVIQAWADTNAVPRGTRVTSANQGTAHKFHNLALVEQTYPPDAGARTGLSVYRATPPIRDGEKAEPGNYWSVKLLERHSCTSQAFIPMGNVGGIGITGFEEPLPKAGRAYLVIVASNGADDKPDLSTLRAFVASTAQGISYNRGVWHHPMISMETAIDFCCVETQIGTPDNQLDCEIVEVESLGSVPRVKIPHY
ncbi:Allantoicase [Ceratobasidium sp. 423]|nr:Allantoicase [Ceratobasidium sp. 423]